MLSYPAGPFSSPVEQLLSVLPSEIRHLKSLKGIYLHGNDDLSLPLELLGPTWSEVYSSKEEPSDVVSILDYYFRAREQSSPLNEAKLILVGFGAVGKTSLVEQLVHGRFDPAERKTEGIAITDWDLRLHDEESVRLHVWDFGGQEIMHATHQFFLTKRSLYLLVLAGRQGREDADAEYWLSLIDSLADKSPVIIVLNKVKEHPFGLNRTALQAKFGFIRDVLTTDCADGTGLEELARAIRRETDALPNLRDPFPASWVAVKDRLSSMQESWLRLEQYQRCCAELGVPEATAQDSLAETLHRLGIALNFREDRRLRDTHVLNPRWVTEGVYRILTHQELADRGGELDAEDLGAILDPAFYPSSCHDYLIELMRKFGLCFRLSESGDRFLIPELLGKEQPAEVAAFRPEACLNFEYHYPTVLPEGVLPRFIVHTYTLSADERRWRTGVILRFGDNRGLVVADPVARRVRVAITESAGSRRELLAVIRTAFERIHADYHAPVLEMVPVPGHPEVLVPYAKLVALDRAGIQEFVEVAGADVLTLKVADLLQGVNIGPVRPADMRRTPGEAAPRAFVSYSHMDERLKDELVAHLSLLQRQGLLEIWHDRRIAPGEDWKVEINRNLERADLILLLVSKDFVTSDYCWGIEMRRALERHAAGSAQVVPIIIRDYAWKSAPFGKLQPLPKDGRAVTSSTARPARDRAWKQVAEGIEKALKELGRKPSRRHFA
jgi:internalin A